MKYLEDLNYLEDKQFPSTRYRHCVKVVERMYEYSKDELGYSEEKAQDMYVLGLEMNVTLLIGLKIYQIDMEKMLQVCF